MTDVSTVAAPQPVQLRHLIVTGKTADGAHVVEAHLYEPVEHLDVIQAYLLSGGGFGPGYDVVIPNPDVHECGPDGEVFDATLHPHYEAHRQLLNSHGITDIAAHVADLKTKASR